MQAIIVVLLLFALLKNLKKKWLWLRNCQYWGWKQRLGNKNLNELRNHLMARTWLLMGRVWKGEKKALTNLHWESSNYRGTQSRCRFLWMFGKFKQLILCTRAVSCSDKHTNQHNQVELTDFGSKVQHIPIDMHVYNATPNVLPQMAKSSVISA